MRKRFSVSFILLILAMISVIRVHARSGGCGDEAYWTFSTSDNTLTISGEGDMTNYADSNAPGWADLKDLIKHVVIEPGITSVGSSCFSNYVNIETVSLPEGLISIENCAFYNCQNIKKIEFPESLERIGGEGGKEAGCVFYSCTGIEEITLPRNLKSILVNSFGQCLNIKTINWNAVDCKANPYNEWITTRYLGVFVGSGVETVNFGPEVKIVPDEVFCQVATLMHINSSGSIEYVGNRAFASTPWVAEQPIGEVVYIDSAAYMYTPDNSFDEIIIEFKPGTRGIRDYMFEGNNRLEKVVIPESVYYVGMSAFVGCQSLNEVVWEAKEIKKMPENNDRGYLFSSAIRKITFGDNVTDLPSYFLYGCTNLKSLSLPNSLVNIGNYAFENSGLKTLSIPNRVEYLGFEALTDLSNLEELTLGECLKEIRCINLFSGCSKLNTLIWNAENADVTTSYSSGNFLNYAPIENFIVGNKVKRIPNRLFCESTTLKNITWGDSVEEIGQNAFAYCSSLENITLPSSLKRLEVMAFQGTSIDFLVIPENVITLESRSLDCNNLKEMIFLSLNAPWDGGAFGWISTASIYVPDLDEYAGYKRYCEVLPMAIPDVTDFSVGETNPEVKFRCNIPDYTLEITDFPALETEIGKHKALVAGHFEGRQNFDAKFVFEYEIHENSEASLISSDANQIDIYNIEGMRIYKNINKDVLNSLTPGSYIIREGDATRKILIK